MKGYYTVQDLADIWGCSKNAIYALICTHRLRAFKVGVSWRISEEARVEYERGRAS